MNTTEPEIRYFKHPDNPGVAYEVVLPNATASRALNPDYTEVILVPLPTVTLGEPNWDGVCEILVDGVSAGSVYSGDTDAVLAKRRDRHILCAGAYEAASRLLAGAQPTQAAQAALAAVQDLPEADQAWIRGAL